MSKSGNSKGDADFRFSDDTRSSVDRRSVSSSRSPMHESDVRRTSSVQSSAALSPRSREYLRLRVNARERQRMHDMNLALDALRRAMPYAQGPAVKKLSKMNTLLLARNYILLLTRTLDELRRLLIATSAGGGGDVAGLSSRRHGGHHLEMVDALRSFVVRDLNAEHQRYAEELIHREQQQQQLMMQDGGEERSRGGQVPWNTHNSVTSSSSPDTPPKKRRRATTPQDIGPPTSSRDVIISRDVTSAMTSQGHVAEAMVGSGHRVLATQFACPCPHCLDSKPTYIVPLDFAQLQHRTTAQI